MSFLPIAILALTLVGDGPVPYSDLSVHDAKITGIAADGFRVTVKIGRKEMELPYGDCLFYRHEAVRLCDLPQNTLMTAFSNITKVSDTVFRLERIVLIVAGEYRHTKYQETDVRKASWHFGPLRIIDGGRQFHIQDKIINLGNERLICRSHSARIYDFYEIVDDEVVGKKMKIVLRTSKKRVDGKQQVVIEPVMMILPTKGIGKKEYAYILSPWKLDQEKHAGKR